MESGILGFGIRNTALGIWNPTDDWNPESKFYWQIPESSTCNPESTAWNPESKIAWSSLDDRPKPVTHHWEAIKDNRLQCSSAKMLPIPNKSVKISSKGFAHSFRFIEFISLSLSKDFWVTSLKRIQEQIYEAFDTNVGSTMFLFRDILENKKNLPCDEILSLKLQQ